MKIEILNEDKMVKFGGEMYPKDGWCVILSGGPGSGKSMARKFLIPIDGKVYDPDDLSKYIDNKFKVIGDTIKIYDKIYDANIEGFDEKDRTMTNSEWAEYMYNIRKGSGLKKNKFNQMFIADNNGRLPNMIFDVTGGNRKTVQEIIENSHLMGYKVSIIYVITEFNTQKLYNKNRDRKVKDSVIAEITKNVYENLTDILSPTMLAEEVWVIMPVYDYDKSEILNLEVINDKGKKEYDDEAVYDYMKSANVYQIKTVNDSRVNLNIAGLKKFIENQLDIIDKDCSKYYKEYLEFISYE